MLREKNQEKIKMNGILKSELRTHNELCAALKRELTIIWDLEQQLLGRLTQVEALSRLNGKHR